jgi:ADP-heptose:LPS heptosyltransferase
MAWVSEGSKNAPVKLIHWATGAKREYLELFGQEIASSKSGAVTTFKAYSQEVKQRGRPPRAWQRGSFLGIASEPRRPPHTLTAEELAWGRAQVADEPTVLLYPNTNQGSREWPPFYWVELAKLIAAMGARAVISGGRPDSRYDHLSPLYVDWRRSAALMLAARCVVANDSAPAHTAGTLDVPTVVLLGPSHPSMFAHLPSVRCLSVPRETLACANCYFQAPYSDKCESGCLALAHLKPETVAAAVQEILNGSPLVPR